jgi:tetratricopeptide (TPR) repeat protein
VYISEAEFLGQEAACAGPEQKPAASRRAGLWLSVSAAVVVVVAMAGLASPGRETPASAPQQVTPMSPAALPSAALSALAALPVDPTESRAVAAPPAPIRPGDLGQALERYRAALAEKPLDAELLDNVGRILVAMNRPAEAVPFLERAVEAEPFSLVARFDLAVAYGRSGRPREAVEQYEVLVRSGEADVRVHHNLGLALRQLGRNTESAAAFERATALAPDQAVAWLGLALSLEADGRAGEAAAALERFLELEPAARNDDKVHARLARLRSVAEPAAPPPDTENGASRRCP